MTSFLAAFFFDCIVANLCAQWLISSLLFYFVTAQIFDVSFEYTIKKFYFPLTLLLLQDFLLYGRFGLALLWLVPAIGVAWWARRTVLHGAFLVPFAIIAACICFDALVIKQLIGVKTLLLLVTICKICYTWTCGIIIFLGLWGNRCWSTERR